MFHTGIILYRALAFKEFLARETMTNRPHVFKWTERVRNPADKSGGVPMSDGATKDAGPKDLRACLTLAEACSLGERCKTSECDDTLVPQGNGWGECPTCHKYYRLANP